VGLGSDRFGDEFSITGEELDDRRRARMLDESLQILTSAWSGEPMRHRGEHSRVDGMRFLPRPAQRPGVPVWVAGDYGNAQPLRRAARYQGFVPVGLEHPDQLAEIVADLTALARTDGTTDPRPYDLVVASTPAAIRRRMSRPGRPGGLWESPPTRHAPTSRGRSSATDRWRRHNRHRGGPSRLGAPHGADGRAGADGAEGMVVMGGAPDGPGRPGCRSTTWASWRRAPASRSPTSS
jgi:alkanesulfonate monooxygenase SsuD/methylene tetrahydromethanopterin reductase-like flavin-dependent oxidoreductase (luciferase family)